MGNGECESLRDSTPVLIEQLDYRSMSEIVYLVVYNAI